MSDQARCLKDFRMDIKLNFRNNNQVLVNFCAFKLCIVLYLYLKKLISWELTSWEVDLVGVDLMGVDLVGVDPMGVDLVGGHRQRYTIDDTATCMQMMSHHTEMLRYFPEFPECQEIKRMRTQWIPGPFSPVLTPYGLGYEVSKTSTMQDKSNLVTRI